MNAWMRTGLSVLLAAWLGATVLSWWAAGNVFHVLSAERSPSIAERLGALPPAACAAALRHAAGEVNRRLFRGWNGAQLALGALAVLLAWAGGGVAPASRRSWAPWLAGAALAVAAAHAAWLGPWIEALGRSLDFADRAGEAEAVRRFGLLHAAYVGSDLAKAALLLGALWAAGREGDRTVG